MCQDIFERMNLVIEQLRTSYCIRAQIEDAEPILIAPALVVLDYSPSNHMPPASMAFDCGNHPRCWLSTESVHTVDGVLPKRHQSYGDWRCSGRMLYGYSISAISVDRLIDVHGELQNVIIAAYAHMHGTIE